jgi:hypothetical protein
MNELLRSIDDRPGAFIAGLLILIPFLIALAVWQAIQAKKMRVRWEELCDGVQGANLERLLYDHLRGKMEIEKGIEDIQRRLAAQENKMESAKRYVGLVRYDAFSDVGGQQSFALAVYDERGDGFVISSLVGRSDCRVFSKSISRGKADRELTAEEQKAVEEAAYKRSQSLVTSS